MSAMVMVNLIVLLVMLLRPNQNQLVIGSSNTTRPRQIIVLPNTTRSRQISVLPIIARRLLICIIAAKRNNVSYVQHVISEIKNQNVPSAGVFIDLDEHYADIVLPDMFIHLVPTDRKKEGCDLEEGDIRRPNCMSRQQGRDVALGLTRCSEIASNYTWVLMLEDDMLPCPNAIATIHNSIEHFEANSVKVVRFGKFSRALMFPPPRSALQYAQTILANILTMPHDLMINSNWRTGRSEAHNGGSLFQHIGKVSTNKYRNEDAYRQRWDDLRSETCGNPIS